MRHTPSMISMVGIAMCLCQGIASAEPTTQNILNPSPPPNPRVGPVASFIEPYGRIFQARGILCTHMDERPKDVLHCQLSGDEHPKERFLVSPFYGHQENLNVAGVGGGYSNVSNAAHPWVIQASYYHGTTNGPRASYDGFEAYLKYALWQPQNIHLPVVSLVGGVATFGDLGNRADVLLAADERLTSRDYATVNAGWSHLRDSGDHYAFVPGFGVTHVFTNRLSVSADIKPQTAVDPFTGFSVTASYALNHRSGVRGQFGDRGALLFNYIYHWDH